MFYRITFSNSDIVAESRDGKSWYIGTYQVPDHGCYNIEDALFLMNGYNIKSISVVSGENIFGFKVAEGSPRRWEVIIKEGDTKSILGYIYETGEPILAYRYEPTDTKKKELRGSSLMRLLVQLKDRELRGKFPRNK